MSLRCMFTLMGNMNQGAKVDEKEIYLVFMELRCFSSTLPSTPKGEIFSMNADDATMGSILSIVEK